MDPPPPPATLSYLHQLTLALAHSPSLSASAIQSLASLSALTPSDQISSCASCRATILPGINGTVWIERGRVRRSCEGCGRVTGCGGREEGKGREKFESVKKRRKLIGIRGGEEVGHPTGLRTSGATTGAKALSSAATTKETSTRPPTVLTTVAPAAPTPRPPSTAATPPVSVASQALPPPPPPAKQPLPPNASTAHSAHPPKPSTTPHPPPQPISKPTTLDAKAETLKKRKRKAGQSGLAELLEAKKRKEAEEKASKAGGGLLGFLQGI